MGESAGWFAQWIEQRLTRYFPHYSAQLKAVCVEAGMIALREGSKELTHEHFHG